MKPRRILNTFLSVNLLIALSLSSASGQENAQSSGAKKKSPYKTTEIYASDKAAQAFYERDSSPIDVKDGRLNVGLLINEKRDNVITAGFLLDSNPAMMPSITLSIGTRAYLGLVSNENEDLFAFAGGLEASTSVLFEEIPLKLNGSVYFAPDIFTFGNSDRVFDWRVSAGIQIRKTVFTFVGLRFLSFDTRPGDREIDDQIHVGVRWNLDS